MKGKGTVQWTLPRWAAELIFETIQLDSESAAFDSVVRQRLSAALSEVIESPLPPQPAANNANHTD